MIFQHLTIVIETHIAETHIDHMKNSKKKTFSAVWLDACKKVSCHTKQFLTLEGNHVVVAVTLSEYEVEFKGNSLQGHLQI